ncbi:hypothetical protein [Marinobacterium weihaiense]|uniref:Secreted protein n=1 Tax=Marinobacterium weihaiense TaxID=2851016 RepID=A0ABS6M6X3_9GAMM|nr:hypothetical protein [Marinobacterium weihaiense]MBV0932033.1 hypothetical protein [Marinobacterium weihaiense]
MALLRLSATVLRHAFVSMDTGLDTRLVDTGFVVRLRVFPSVRMEVLAPVLTSTVNHAGAHLNTYRFAAYFTAYLARLVRTLIRTKLVRTPVRTLPITVMPLANRVPNSFTPRLWLELVKLLPVGGSVSEIPLRSGVVLCDSGLNLPNIGIVRWGVTFRSLLAGIQRQHWPISPCALLSLLIHVPAYPQQIGALVAFW